MKKLQNSKGITIISLVVTIIVLIILAGVSINLTLGNDGIITKAKQAKENMELAQVEEATRLNELYAEMNFEESESSNYDAIVKLEEFKSVIATAITNQGIETSSDDTAEAMAENIGKIAQGDTTGTAIESDILETKTAWVNGNKLTGTMSNNGELNWNPTTSETYTIPAGYYSGGTLDSLGAYNAGYDTGYSTGYSEGFSIGKTTISGSFTNQPEQNYYTYTDYIINNSGYTTLKVSSNANYWYVYDNSTGNQIGSRCQTEFDISGISSIKIRVQCSINKNNGYATTTYDIS